MMNFVVFALAFCGFSAIAVSMERHARQVLGRVLEGAPRYVLMTLGWGLLAGSLILALATRGPSIGSLLWLGLLTMAGVSIGLILTYRPRRLRLVGPVLLMLAVSFWGVFGR